MERLDAEDDPKSKELLRREYPDRAFCRCRVTVGDVLAGKEALAVRRWPTIDFRTWPSGEGSVWLVRVVR